MVVYDFFVTYVLPLFVDLSKFEHGEAIFYYFFTAVITLCLVISFIYIPFKIGWNWISRITKNRKGTHFDLW